MSRKWTLFGLLMVGLVLAGFGWAPVASAQEENPPAESTCRECHESRYWLYDTGKWYCLCGKQGACIDCHGGTDGTWDAEAAHQDIIKNPITENPGVCQKCHAEDAAERIERFAAVAGFDPSALPTPTPTPYVAAAASTSRGPYMPALKSWQVAGLGLVAVLFGFVFVFGFRCWRADCLSKTLRL